MTTLTVNIFRFELAAVMIDRAFTDHCTYRSLHFITSNLQNFTVLGSVTLVKSNAKALLTGEPIKNATCKQVLRSPRGRSGFLKKATCTLQKLYPCRSASMVTMFSVPPKTPTRPSRIVTLFQRKTNPAPIVTAFVLITDSILIEQTPCIDIQLHRQSVCFHINAEKVYKLCGSALPF